MTGPNARLDRVVRGSHCSGARVALVEYVTTALASAITLALSPSATDDANGSGSISSDEMDVEGSNMEGLGPAGHMADGPQPSLGQPPLGQPPLGQQASASHCPSAGLPSAGRTTVQQGLRGVKRPMDDADILVHIKLISGETALVHIAPEATDKALAKAIEGELGQQVMKLNFEGGVIAEAPFTGVHICAASYGVRNGSVVYVALS